MAPKRSGVAAHDEAEFEAKRCRRLGQLVAEYGEDQTLMGSVTIVVGGVEHVDVVNRLVLAQSEVFRGMLTNGLREATQGRIELPDMSADCWRALHAYLQSGDVSVEESATAVEVPRARRLCVQKPPPRPCSLRA